ncbi:hypothetical protein [Helicobacter pametensis]|uniref:hypothetical protein n=1 Tax=Helicobacter pametensis TaxID=95149 RepID=UPI00048820F4|nr:hypothetical protein [Helicobacter pametensis]
MKILLINTNPVVQKLVEMTSKKIECELEVIESLMDLEQLRNLDRLDLVIVDDDVLVGADSAMISALPKSKTLALVSTQEWAAALFPFVIRKPFLPNELLDLLLKAKALISKNMEEDEEFNQLLKDLEIQSIKSETQNDITTEGSHENQEEFIAREEEHPSPRLEESSGGVLDLNEIAKIKTLLHEEDHKDNTKSSQQDGLMLLERILRSGNTESLRHMLNGMQLTINISFPQKDDQ